MSAVVVKRMLAISWRIDLVLREHGSEQGLRGRENLILRVLFDSGGASVRLYIFAF